MAPPIGAREPRPVIIAAHGAGDRPEWACGGWRLAAHTYPFVVCPRGRPAGNGRFAWASSRALDEAVSRTLTAVKARYGDYVNETSRVYAGFSQGAILSEPTLLAVPGRFEAAVFAEGGYDVLARPSFGASYRAVGGERLLIVCGGPACFGRGRRSLPALERSGLRVWLRGDASAGHNLNDRMQVSLRAAWPEFVRGLPGWEGFPANGP